MNTDTTVEKSKIKKKWLEWTIKKFFGLGIQKSALACIGPPACPISCPVQGTAQFRQNYGECSILSLSSLPILLP